jgi:hypothetical protein
VILNTKLIEIDIIAIFVLEYGSKKFNIKSKVEKLIINNKKFNIKKIFIFICLFLKNNY